MSSSNSNGQCDDKNLHMVVAGMAVIVKFLEGERCAVVSQAKF